jgi:hypothetical protein
VASAFVLPLAPGYDAWAWLTWGREAGRLELSTVDGPAWKPLPVAVTALLAPAGDAAPALWLLLVRAGPSRPWCWRSPAPGGWRVRSPAWSRRRRSC